MPAILPEFQPLRCAGSRTPARLRVWTYAAMAPLFEHYGAQLWLPEAGGRVDAA
jgi:hypothetical protein